MMKIQIDGNFFEVDQKVGEYFRWLEEDNLRLEQEKRLIVDRMASFNDKLVKEVAELDIEVYNLQNNMSVTKTSPQH